MPGLNLGKIWYFTNFQLFSPVFLSLSTLTFFTIFSRSSWAKYIYHSHSQLRMKRSSLNSHLHPIGLSLTPVCQCGKLESVKHFLIDCDMYTHLRVQLFSKLDGLLERKVSSYTKTNLCHILLFGEKPHLPEKFLHNKFIFLSLQRFLINSKRFQSK